MSASGVKQDKSPPRTPTGLPRSFESDADISSPNASQDERLAKELSIKESGHAHRPKRRRFHESYNFNMKCPTPGCNSLGTLHGHLRRMLTSATHSHAQLRHTLARSPPPHTCTVTSAARSPPPHAHLRRTL
ncbi:histone acetyltransferase KAT7a isoform X1, partial [Tachysurus ichikawai]